LSEKLAGVKMKKIAYRLFMFLMGTTIAISLASCSSGGAGDGSATDAQSGGTGTVGLLLTDKPADPSLFDSINASIEKAELIGSDDNRVVLYSGPTRTFDLLRLKNESIPFTFNDNVPVGQYCKIRLILSDLELVLADDTPADPTDNETYHPKLPGNGKLDLVARDCFYVGPGKTVTLQIDIDGGNSIHVVENGKGFNFRPVIFVDVLDKDFDARLVRLEGEISRIDEGGNAFLLCDAIPTYDSSLPGCVIIHLGDDSAYFDNVEYEGAPRPLDELLADDMLGQRVMVVGWPRYTVPSYDHVEIPDGHYPPPGECKLWDIGLDAGLQPPPGDCDELSALVTEGLVLVTHDGVDKDDYHPLMAVDALAVEYGSFLQVEGNVATNADTSGFDMSVSSGGPVITEAALGVEFQPGDVGYNGTRVVSKSGVLLDPLQVVVPLPVQVDGTLELVTDADPVLKAALVILDKGEFDTQQLTGTVLTVGADSLTLAPDASVVCGMATSDVFVRLTADIKILTVTITESGSVITPGGVIVPGQDIGMNGRCDASGYVTDNVVIVDDQRP
jgi:hypothetical protein